MVYIVLGPEVESILNSPTKKMKDYPCFTISFSICFFSIISDNISVGFFNSLPPTLKNYTTLAVSVPQLFEVQRYVMRNNPHKLSKSNHLYHIHFSKYLLFPRAVSYLSKRYFQVAVLIFQCNTRESIVNKQPYSGFLAGSVSGYYYALSLNLLVFRNIFYE